MTFFTFISTLMSFDFKKTNKEFLVFENVVCLYNEKTNEVTASANNENKTFTDEKDLFFHLLNFDPMSKILD